jgi:hypothetical protein
MDRLLDRVGRSVDVQGVMVVHKNIFVQVFSGRNFGDWRGVEALNPNFTHKKTGHQGPVFYIPRQNHPDARPISEWSG